MSSSHRDDDDKQSQLSPAVETPVAPLPNELPYIDIGHPDSMMSKESVRRAVEEFVVKPSDIIVATFPKTGTTLVTWICHQLRTGGDINFDTIYEVVPWPTLSWDIGYDPNVQGNQFFPRVFKSHLRMASIYRGCKYIVTIRDPIKIALSFYNFLGVAKKVPFVMKMDLSTFVCDTPFLKGKADGSRASLWEYYKEYHILRDCSSVLVLIYEDLVNDLPSSIRMIANFMNINIDDGAAAETEGGGDGALASSKYEELIMKVANMSTKEYMANHMEKFDEPYERAKQLNRAGDLSQLAPGAKVAVKPHEQKMDDAGMKFLNDQWQQIMGPLGYDNYGSFAAMFREKNKKRFCVQ